MIEFYVPASSGEWLAFLSALATLLYGLVAFLMPRTALRLLHLAPAGDRPEGLAESRAALGGFRVGLGLVAILFAQPLIYLVLGAAWGAAAIGRLLSMLFDRAVSIRSLVALLVEAALAAAAVADVLQLV
jgi:hypothetical protein